jgi:hypothetical protein
MRYGQGVPFLVKGGTTRTGGILGIVAQGQAGGAFRRHAATGAHRRDTYKLTVCFAFPHARRS